MDSNFTRTVCFRYHPLGVSDFHLVDRLHLLPRLASCAVIDERCSEPQLAGCTDVAPMAVFRARRRSSANVGASSTQNLKPRIAAARSRNQSGTSVLSQASYSASNPGWSSVGRFRPARRKWPGNRMCSVTWNFRGLFRAQNVLCRPAQTRYFASETRRAAWRTGRDW